MSTLGRNLDLHAPSARRDHIHIVAVLYVGATFMLLLGAMSSQNNLLFAIVGLALAAVIVSGFIAGSSMMGLRFARRLPVRVEADTTTQVVYTTFNKNKFISAYAVRIVDSAIGPTELSIPLHAGISRVAANDNASATAGVQFPHRGRWVLGPGRLYTMFPFGISKKSVRFDGKDTVVVMPRSVILVRGGLGEFESSGDDGRADLRRKGGGAELYNLRDYQRGDPVTSIAWQASARWNKLISREVAAPQTKRVWIVIEASTNDLRLRESSAEASVRLALAAGRRLTELGVATGLHVPSCGVTVVPDRPDSAWPAWYSILATLGDESVQKNQPRALGTNDGIIAIGSGSTPGSSLVLDPAREEQLVKTARVTR
jgi:uncharacterized protein (DUF58 family)